MPGGTFPPGFLYFGGTMKKNSLAVVIILVILGISACQQVFTYSVFEDLGLQRDVSTLPPAQQTAYARSALASGDTAAMQDAYEAIEALIAETTAEADPDLYTLGAELAIGASGLMDTLTEALATLAEGGDISTLFDFEDATIDILDDATGYIEALDNADQDVSTDLYVNGAAALLIVAIDDAGGVENLDYENPPAELEQALEWATLGDVDLESLLGG